MPPLLGCLMILIPATALLGFILLPSSVANRWPQLVRTVATRLAAVQASIATLLAVAFGVGLQPSFHHQLLSLGNQGQVSVGVYYDGATCLMLALVSFVGWVIASFSVRYLDGESTQGRYYRWTAFTIGAVVWMVVSGNLLMFFVAWVMTSLGLHQLLLHYADRPTAQRAAWTKFMISRLGDLALIGALVLVYIEFGTWDFATLFSTIANDTTRTSHTLAWASLLVVCGAVTKSAQVPFHTWLPITLETPSPVSALMHAGIVNAGGYLVIRLSPLLVQTPDILAILAIFGVLTACLGSIVMQTQTSVKSALAYSTVAQMGFMMLQCGLGAFSAAMLHIVAHSLYKAFAFLNSGQVMAERAAVRGIPNTQHTVSWVQFAAAGGFVSLCCLGSLRLAGIDLFEKPGGLVLGFVLCMALTNWLVQALRFGTRAVWVRSAVAISGLCLIYATSYRLIDGLLIAHSQPAVTSTMGFASTIVAVLAFGGIMVLQLLQSRMEPPKWLQAWFVHASNGFYFDATIRRAVIRNQA